MSSAWWFCNPDRAWSRYTGFAGFVWFHVFHGVPWKLVLLVLQDFPMLFCPSCRRESGYDSKLGAPLNPWNGPMNSNSCAKDLRSCSLNQVRTFTRHSGHYPALSTFVDNPDMVMILCPFLRWPTLSIQPHSGRDLATLGQCRIVFRSREGVKINLYPLQQ